MIDLLIRQQDYFWFLALTSLTAALVLGLRRQPGGPAATPWLPWLIGGNMLMAAAELTRISQPVQLDPYRPVNLSIDLALGFILAFQVWGILGFAGRWRWPWLAFWLGLAWLRTSLPWTATLGLCAAASGGLAWRVCRPENKPERLPAAVALCTLWLSPIGPVTNWLNNQIVQHLSRAVVGNAPAGSPMTALTAGLRRWSITGSWGVWVSLLLFLAGLFFLWMQLNRVSRLQERREWVRFGSLAGLWLLTGIFLAAVLGYHTRRSYEAACLAGAKLAAGLLDPAEMQRAFGPLFDPQVADPASNPRGWATVSKEFQLAVMPVRRHLARIEAASPAEVAAVLLVDRNGWRTIAAFGDNKPYRPEIVTLLEPAGPGPGARPEPEFLPPYQGALGITTQARVPLFFPDGRVLGWLALIADPEEWLAGQAQARLQAFAIVGLGLGLAFMGLIQRLKGLARDDALMAAELARQADQTKTEFLARVSHELRTPLQGVLGYGEQLKSSVPEEDGVGRSRIEALRQLGLLMLHLVNDLLDLSAFQTGRFRFTFKPTKVVELVRQTVESYRPAAEGKGLVFAADIAPGAPAWWLADSVRLRQVVINLVSNAIKFTDAGSVRVVFGAEDNGDLVLKVDDTGPGIPRDGEARLFQPFTRLEGTAEKEGSGLGLALAASLCESMGGGIVLKHRPGPGSCFIARFRLAPCSAPPVVAEPTAARSLQGRRILVVDDNTLIREQFRAYLADKGAECEVARNGAEALKLAGGGSYDVVVLDLAMPGMNGAEVARALRRGEDGKMRIVGVSAHASEEDKKAALAAGMNQFLTKPVELPVLAEALAATQASEPPPTPPPGPGDPEKRQAWMCALFRAEAGVLEAELATAAAEKNWPMIQARAHYLKNSADVMQLQLLSETCRDLEVAAGAEDFAAVVAATQVCLVQLRAWR